MSGSSAHKDLKPTATQVVTGLSCAAAFLSIAAIGPGEKPLPGTRTAFGCPRAVYVVRTFWTSGSWI